MDHFGYLYVLFSCFLVCLVFLFSCLFIEALWSPAGKGLTTWLFLYVMFCHFPMCPGSGVVLDCIAS